MLTKYQNANSKMGLGSKTVAVIYAFNTMGFFSPSRPCVVHSIRDIPPTPSHTSHRYKEASAPGLLPPL